MRPHIGLLEGSFSAVSEPNFASKYTFESSRRDLHNAFLCTALQSHRHVCGMISSREPGFGIVVVPGIASAAAAEVYDFSWQSWDAESGSVLAVLISD